MSTPPTQAELRALSRSELNDRVQKELWGQWTYAVVGAIASVPLSRHLPRAQRFVPLLVLGAIGSLADFKTGQKRAEPYQRRLEELDAEASRSS